MPSDFNKQTLSLYVCLGRHSCRWNSSSCLKLHPPPSLPPTANHIQSTYVQTNVEYNYSTNLPSQPQHPAEALLGMPPYNAPCAPKAVDSTSPTNPLTRRSVGAAAKRTPPPVEVVAPPSAESMSSLSTLSLSLSMTGAAISS